MDIRKSLETSLLTCRICNKPFDKPKVLSCMHTFCKPCLELVLQEETLEAAKKRRNMEQQHRSSGYSSSSSTSQYKGRWTQAFKVNDRRCDVSDLPDDTLQCPLCSKRTTLPATGIHGLPNDQLAGKLASIVGKIPNYPVCDVCSSGHPDIYADTPLNNGNSVVHNPHPNHRPWTDAEDEDSNSDTQSTENEDDCNKNGGVYNRSASGTRPRNGHRFSRNGQKKKTFNASDDELFTPSWSTKLTNPNEAVGACLECAKRLCEGCLQNHTKLPVTASHVIVALDQFAELTCSRHPREIKRFFCLTCGQLICLVCTFESSISDLNSEDENDNESQATGHADHDILSIRQGLKQVEQNIKKSIFDCKQKAERLEIFLLGLRSCLSNVVSLKCVVNEAADNLIKSINVQRGTLLRELDEDVGIQSDQLTSQCEIIRSSLTSWEELKTEDDTMEIIYGLHPVEALTEASLIRDRYYGMLELLRASVPLHGKWSQLVKEIDSLDQSFAHQTIVDSHENNIERETSYETDSSSVTSTEPLKTNKRVRFAPPSEANGIIPPAYNAHWTHRLGKFIPGEGVKLGRRATPGQLAAEAFARKEKYIDKAIQASPTDVNGRPLPAERDTRRHRAIQVDLRSSNQMESAIQTEPCTLSAAQRIKLDFGTQYQSSDINAPTSFFRSSKQIMVQK